MDRKRRVFNVVAGSKIKHLKKPDGEPLWRADIQYDFLHAIFHSQERVFTNFYTKEPNKTFAEIYIDAMARSSKCSKILGERLLSGGSAPLNIAMVCILVNIGRMNTTLNFFPEMKAQLRTYHPIPSLQSSDQLQDKQLQDAPRLKSILKGACENTGAPETLKELETSSSHPQTNPINLIFILANQFAEVEEKFFTEPYKFSDLIMSSNYSSASRARAFLWLCWAYLESDMSPELLSKNPFGDGGVKVPALELLSSAQVQLENVDPAIEVNFGQQMLRQRIRYIETGTAQPQKRHTSSHHTAEALLVVPVATNPNDKRYLYEFEKLLRERRILKRRRRHKRGVLATQFEAIKDIDPVYTSDSETVATAGSLPSLGLRQYGATSEDRTGDYGEFFATIGKVFRKINQTNTVVPPPVEPLRITSESI